MQAIFNELSAQQLADKNEEQAKEIVLNLIQVCKQLQAIDSTFQMRINEHFWNIQLDAFGTIREYLSYDGNLKDYRILLDAITDSPYLPNDDMDINLDRFLDGNLVWETTIVDPDSGIRVAYAFDPKPALMISFATNDWREINIIKVKPISAPIVCLINIATIKQVFEVHFEQIATEYIELNIGNPTTVTVDNILPNKDITNLYLDYFQFYTERNNGKVLDTNIPIKTIEIKGGIVAKINGWIRHGQYSIINKREVFSHNKSNTIFIAIDREKGDFEVHSSAKNKNHLGAISFDGAKTEKPKGHKLKFEHGE